MGTAKKVYECDKCNGTGHLSHYANIANGVCFKCAGTGKLVRKPAAKKVRPLNSYQIKMIAVIKEGNFSTMNYNQLHECRDFAHWPIDSEPGLLDLWNATGESFFQEAQEYKLQEFYANR